MATTTRRRSPTRPTWGRVARVAAVVAFVGLFAVDCCNATGDWAWVDVTRAPHMAAVGGRNVAAVAAPQHHRNQPALPASAVSLVAVLVLLGLVRSDDRVLGAIVRVVGPPRRGPPRAVLTGAPT